MTVNLSSPDKVLWPEPGITKRELADYYEAVAPRMLPHIAGRPLTLIRANAGIEGERFIQKNLPDSAPDFVTRYEAWSPSSNRTVAYALADAAEDLRYFANQNAVELHAWFARIDDVERADTIAFDLDPPAGPAPEAAADGSVPVFQAAHWVRETLVDLGLDARIKTSGKRGLHLYVPVVRKHSYGELRGFTLAVARRCAARHPDELTVEMRKEDRGSRLLLDWSRSGQAQTLAVPYSPRAHPAGTVSTPLDWDEVDERLDVTSFTIRTVLDRPDPWSEKAKPYHLSKAWKQLVSEGFEPVDRSPRVGGRRKKV